MKSIEEAIKNFEESNDVKKNDDEKIIIDGIEYYIYKKVFVAETYEDGKRKVFLANVDRKKQGVIYVTDTIGFVNSNKLSLRSLAEASSSNFMSGKCSCPSCGGTGSILLAKPEFIATINPGVQLIREDALWYQVCPLCKGKELDVSSKFNFEEKPLDRFTTANQWQKDMKDKALRFLQSVESGEKPWLYLGGQVGCGKTFLAELIKDELEGSFNGVFIGRNNYGVSYPVTVMKYTSDVAELKALSNTTDQTSKITSLMKTDFLIIDDLFKNGNKVNPSDADVKMMYSILEYRDSHHKITIITSEFSVEELLKITDASVGSRIFENTGKNKFYHYEEYDPKKNYRIYAS